MTHIVKEEISQYCENHSSQPSSLTEELAAYTIKNVEYPQMLSGSLVASFLGMMIRLVNATRILEVGTYTGYSALCMAENLPSNGELITLDISRERVAVGQTFWDKSPHGKKIKSVLGPAIETMKTLKPAFDLVFIDADKPGYLQYLKSALPLLSETGVVVVDNCLWNGTVLEKNPTDPDAIAIKAFNDFVASNSTLQKTLVPIRDGLFVIRKVK